MSKTEPTYSLLEMSRCWNAGYHAALYDYNIPRGKKEPPDFETFISSLPLHVVENESAITTLEQDNARTRDEIEILTKAQRQIAATAWKAAAKAFRLYPHNKHTFTEYFSAIGENDIQMAINDARRSHEPLNKK